MAKRQDDNREAGMNGGEAKAIFDKLDGLGKGQAAMNAEVAGMRAKLDISISQHERRLELLDKAHAEHERRVSRIENSYVTRSDHKVDCDENRQEHRDFRDAIDNQKTFAGRIGGGIAVGALVAGALMGWIFFKFGG